MRNSFFYDVWFHFFYSIQDIIRTWWQKKNVYSCWCHKELEKIACYMKWRQPEKKNGILTCKETSGIVEKTQHIHRENARLCIYYYCGSCLLYIHTENYIADVVCVLTHHSSPVYKTILNCVTVAPVFTYECECAACI